MKKKKKTGGARFRDRVRVRGSIGLGMGGLKRIGGLIGGVNRDRGVNRDWVRAGDEHIIPFEKKN